MASYNMKQIEYLRQKANLTYEQAIALLDRNGGDITQALIELERTGQLSRDGADAGFNGARSTAGASGESRVKGLWDNLVDLFIKGIRLKLVIEKDDRTLVCLPVIYLILLVIFTNFKFLLVSVILLFVLGCRVHLLQSSDPRGDWKIRNFAKGAERTVRKKVSEATRHEGDDYDSYTAE